MRISEIDSVEEVFLAVSHVAEELNMPSYTVGGFVRDQILARQTKDIDIVCVGDGISLSKAVANRLSKDIKLSTFKRFGTSMFKWKGLEFEFVGARRESYSSDSRKPDVSPGSLGDDQKRRDFTINALAISLNKTDYGAFVDPFEGVQDIQDKIIRTPLDPEATFSDDPLRMMRAIRFAVQLGFEIHPEVMAGIELSNSRLKIVSKERISIELNKIMASDNPSKGLDLLDKTGLLALILPELIELKGAEIRNGIGHKDNYYHTLEVLNKVVKRSDNIWLRWAAVLHDIAKPATKRFNRDQGWTFHGHEALGGSWVPRIFRRLRFPLDSKMKYVQKLVTLHLRPIGLSKEEVTDSAIRRLLFDAGNELEDLLLLCECDITSKNPEKVKRYLENYKVIRKRLAAVEEKDRLLNWQPPVSGDQIMKAFDLKPSREVGQIKLAIREAILDGEIGNDFDEAYQLMLKKGKALGLIPV